MKKARTRQRTVEIRQFIVDWVRDHPADIIPFTANRFVITRQAIGKHIRELVNQGVIKATGKTRSRTYELLPIYEKNLKYQITEEFNEDMPWEKEIRPTMDDVPKNVRDICIYVFTEIVNNAIEHSSGSELSIKYLQTKESINFKIFDNGIGIFKKIATAMNFDDERHSILELAKGKFTTDPERHTGEGIFFSSRMVELFSLMSGDLYFTHFEPDNDWLIETETKTIKGTFVDMTVSMRSLLHPKDLFEKFESSGENVTFSKTHVPIRLASFRDDPLVSRSKARRILTRFESFEEVLLDFAGVDFIGRAFADEIFRVFRQCNPGIKIISINANPVVWAMIKRSMNHGKNQQF